MDGETRAWRSTITSTTWNTATSCWRRWEEAPMAKWRRPSSGTPAERWDPSDRLETRVVFDIMMRSVGSWYFSNALQLSLPKTSALLHSEACAHPSSAGNSPQAQKHPWGLGVVVAHASSYAGPHDRMLECKSGYWQTDGISVTPVIIMKTSQQPPRDINKAHSHSPAL